MGSRILLLLILASRVWGQDKMNQIQSLYEAVENQTITLEWTFTIRRPLRYYQVYCEHITDDRISVVLHVENGVQFPGSQHPDFTGRVQFDEEVFREGRLRVHVSRLQTEDSGLYQCEVETEYGSSSGKSRLNVSGELTPDDCASMLTLAPHRVTMVTSDVHQSAPFVFWRIIFRLFLFVTAAANETQTLRPGLGGPGPEGPGPEKPGPEIRSRTGLFVVVGLTTVLLVLVVAAAAAGRKAGTFELNQIQSLYEAVENQTITLEWTFTIRRPLRYYQVFCEHITDDRISVVLHVEQGVQFPDSQHPDFTGRVQFDEEVFREGRLRVHVSRLQTTDSGLYKCEVETEYGGSVGKCRLNVSAAANETQTLRPGPEGPGPEGPGPEIHGRTGLFVVVGLTAVVLLVLVFAAAAGRKCPGSGGKEFPAAMSYQRSRHVE
ncbi:uncharacterized protein V6R79_008621 [Siganus canaliculatus]